MKILDELFMNCSYFNDDIYRLLTTSEISKYDATIGQILRTFERSLEDETIKNQFLEFCEVLTNAYTDRDAAICRLLITQGMALNMQLTTEILTTIK